MPLPLPKLDDRTFEDLVSDAIQRVKAAGGAWTDFSAGDPGMALIDVFAFLTEAMLYRLNRVPAKLYVALLNVVGVQLRAPAAAIVRLTFTPSADKLAADVEIPPGTLVATGDGAVVFRLVEGATFKKSDSGIDLRALHCEVVEGELLGLASGKPGESFRVKNGPIIAPTGDQLDIVVGVELAAGEPPGGARTRQEAGKVFALWQNVENFAAVEPGVQAFVADRASGLIIFAPAGDGGAPLAAVPKAGREVRAWYRRGGGASGNVAPGTVTTIKSPALKQLKVTNRERGVGGAPGETVEEALRRGPLALASMHTAVTQRDFERATEAAGAVRARALTMAQAWRHADPGTVQILLLPTFEPEAAREGAVTAPDIVARRTDDLRARVEKLVDARRPLGVRVQVGWTQVRPVSVSARVIVGRGEDHDALRGRIHRRLNALLSPFRDTGVARSLRASDGYDAIMGTPGVRYAENLRFRIAQAPETDVTDVVRDPHQPHAWFAAAKKGLYRTLDDGDSWSIVFEREGHAPCFVRRHPDKAGLLALVTQGADGFVLHLSKDCGETWKEDVVVRKTEISDAAWALRNGQPLLFLAAKDGLFRLQPDVDAGPSAIVVDKAIDAKGYYAVTAHTTTAGLVVVAVSAREKGDVYLSALGGNSDTFRATQLANEDIRTLAVQRFNARDFLWAGSQAEAGEPGDGTYRLELRPNGEFEKGSWTAYREGWTGGSCQGLAFVDGVVFAASNRAGVLKMDSAAAKWIETRIDAGLPIRDRQRLREVTASVAAAPGAPETVLGAGPVGVFRSLDGGERYTRASLTEFSDRVPLPANWVYCADEHTLDLVSEDEEG